MSEIAVPSIAGLETAVAAILQSLGITALNTNQHNSARPIFPTAVYDQRQAEEITGLSTSTLFRAVEAGKLTCRRAAGRRRLYLGSDLLAYLQGGDQ